MRAESAALVAIVAAALWYVLRGIDDVGPEWWASARASRLGIDNTPPEHVKANLRQLREALNATFGAGNYRLTGAYRSPELNAATPGADPHSLHMQGRAADVDVSPFSQEEGAEVARSTGRFRQIKADYDDGHLHVAI